MTRKFRVTIGGVTYLVEVEEVDAAGNPAAAPAGPVASFQSPSPAVAPPAPPAPPPALPPVQPVPVPPPAAQAAPAEPRRGPARDATAEGEVVRAPLPGTIVAVRCQVGQAVRAGDVVAVLEAMKMENDITAPRDGTVQEVLVEKGATVGLGDALVVIR